MKTKLLFIGTLLCLLVSTPLYAQKMKEVKQKKMEQMEIVQPPRKIVPVKKRVIHGHIDPITGEEVIPQPTPPPKEYDLSFTYPESSDYYPYTSWSIMTEETLTVRGLATGEHTLEIYMKYRGTVIKDWEPVYVQANGVWETQINWGGTGSPQGTKLTISVRDTADRSEVKKMYLGQRPFRGQASQSGGN